VEIGSLPLAVGSIHKVKVLGVLAMIDDGELDWKVIAINSEDALASQLNDVGDVEAKCPGTLSGIREWFRWYKTPDDKPEELSIAPVPMGQGHVQEGMTRRIRTCPSSGLSPPR